MCKMLEVNSKMILDGIDKKSGLARVEIGDTFITLPLSLIPEGCLGGEVLKIIVDQDSTKELKDDTRKLENKLFKKKTTN